MGNKKIYMGVSASAIVASAFFAAQSADAASYSVKSGDSLWTIAQKYNTTVSHLKSINNLSSDLIFPKQVIYTDKKASSNTSKKKSSAPASSGKTTYTVKSGDSLSSIAYKYNVSINDLMKWNNLDSTLIFPGNVFIVNSSAANKSSSSASSKKTSSGSSSSKGSVYTVKSGDTLSGIASQHGVTVSNLKKWNNLHSSLILIGQKLQINGSSAAPSKTTKSGSSNVSNSKANSSSSSAPFNVNKLVSTAKAQNGVKYVWGGSSPSGFDCSGFIHYVYNKAGYGIGRLSSEGYYNRSHMINNPQVGDLVFFSGTYKAGISHLGVYLGGGNFIHAGSDGVEISNLSNPYWKSHFDSYKRFY